MHAHMHVMPGSGRNPMRDVHSVLAKATGKSVVVSTSSAMPALGLGENRVQVVGLVLLMLAAAAGIYFCL